MSVRKIINNNFLYDPKRKTIPVSYVKLLIKELEDSTETNEQCLKVLLKLKTKMSAVQEELKAKDERITELKQELQKYKPKSEWEDKP